MTKFILLLFILFLNDHSNADIPNRNPSKIPSIEQAFLQCNNNTTCNVDSTNCASNAYNQYDKALNEIYNALIEKLNSKNDIKQKLVESQRDWIKYRDKEFKFIEEMHGSLEGTKWYSILFSHKADIVKHRIEELEEYFYCISQYVD